MSEKLFLTVTRNGGCYDWQHWWKVNSGKLVEKCDKLSVGHTCVTAQQSNRCLCNLRLRRRQPGILEAPYWNTGGTPGNQFTLNSSALSCSVEGQACRGQTDKEGD